MSAMTTALSCNTADRAACGNGHCVLVRCEGDASSCTVVDGG